MEKWSKYGEITKILHRYGETIWRKNVKIWTKYGDILVTIWTDYGQAPG